MLSNSSFCHTAYFLWHFFRLWINVRVKRSLGRRWGDWYWFMAACEALRRVWAASRSSASIGRLSSLGAQITMIYVEAGLWLTAAMAEWPASVMMGGDISPGQGSLCSAPMWSPTLGCRDRQRDGHYIITETFIGQIRKSLLRRRKKDLSIWSL